MTLGMAGLLDDTYLAMRILENLNRGPDPLFDADFREPLRFLKRLVGPEISRKLDAASIFALQDVSHPGQPGLVGDGAAIVNAVKETFRRQMP